MPLTPNNREEHWLQGMVDGQTDLTPNKRREYWYKEIVDAIGSGGGGGGGTGGGVLVVNATSTETEVVLDKTWKEIYDAPFASISMKFDEDLESYKFYVGSVVKNPNNTYSVFAFEIGSSYHITGYEFVASSPTDYPVAQMG